MGIYAEIVAMHNQSEKKEVQQEQKEPATEILTLKSLFDNYSADGKYCTVKFVSPSLILKEVMVPVVKEGKLIKKGKDENVYIDYVPVFFKNDQEGRNLSYKLTDYFNLANKYSKSNGYFKDIVLNYVKENASTKAVQAIQKMLQDPSAFFNPESKQERDILYQEVPEFVKLHRNYTKPLLIAFFNIIPDYKLNTDYPLVNYIEGEELKNEAQVEYIKKDRSSAIEIEKYRAIKRTDNLEADLTRTPIRLIRLKSNYIDLIHKKFTEEVENQDDPDNKGFGIDTSARSFVFKFEKTASNNANQKFNSSYDIIPSRKTFDLTEQEKNLLRWEIKDSVPMITTEAQVQETLLKNGFNTKSNQQIQDIIPKTGSVTFEDITTEDAEQLLNQEDLF